MNKNHSMMYEGRGSGKRKAGGRKAVKTSRKRPAVIRQLSAGWKGFIRQGKTVLAAAGLVWLLFGLAKRLGSG